MLPKKYLPFVTPLLMSILMVFVMTGVVTAANTGIEGAFFQRWAHAYMVAWPIAFLFIYFMGKRVQAFAARICSLES
ncbi:Protein of unknown function [Oceanospirillum multiglobuliferum]|uniref:DUF2798 domain-containing protein n=1 Tax=Oceanospirillum multiglobuliferum TaxID=64969 RepID=A0A1T4PNV3_9GAMM|nr:DUF2798 domain-containing protein [Oceanospirillum multiglobuliferum]OPX55393.1 hypothetical protein BTE48_09515 [Oceanospirillum multiglobuliferum]SJZ93223.1 Protein of unknown function [Oceanospirillum multiglobuliferum]